MTAESRSAAAFAGPALFSFGFRPFFLFGAFWAALAVALWLPMLAGTLVLPTHFAPIDWHVHELLFGYVPAIVAGFLLTAVANWTGRPPVAGLPLIGLFALWAAGRAAVAFSHVIGAAPAAAIDLAFLAALAWVAGREIVQAKNARNLKVLGVLALLFAGNAAFHFEAMRGSGGGYGARLGVGASILLILLIAGRIVPAFTRNWLARRGPGRLPPPFDRFDAAIMIASAAALVAWIAAPTATATAALAVLAGLANAVRLGRWAGERTFAEPLVAILHIAFAFVPLGFFLLALGIAAPAWVTPTGAVHGWTAGAIGLMTLAVMTRASLGHCGRPLVATRPIQFIYAAAALAALARIAAAFGIGRESMLQVSATAWVLAFGGFAILYAPMLLRRRPA